MTCMLHGYFEGYCELCCTRTEVVDEEVLSSGGDDE